MTSTFPRNLFAAVTFVLAATGRGEPGQGERKPPPGKPVPVIHVSDLFRPHNDPDDHWDLACVYAQAWKGQVNLLGVLIDYPQPGRQNDPDVMAVAQMNYLTGKTVPTMIGSPRWIDPADAAKPESAAAIGGVRAFMELLRRSPEPVVIHVLGSCRDVAMAAKLDPALFAKKCAAVYLNAGSGTPDKAIAAQLEWNVRLDRAAYAAMFSLPCPVYWMPCFEAVQPVFQIGEHGTFYRFRQGEVLPSLSDGMQNYFVFMFKHGRSGKKGNEVDALRPDWLRTLVGPKDEGYLARIGAMDRNMWCTGGFLHAVGLTVESDGRIAALAEVRAPVFTFDPVDVRCAPDGVTTWNHDPTARKRFVFHVRDLQRYQPAMTSALRSLLAGLR